MKNRKLKPEPLENRRVLAVAVPANVAPPSDPADILVGTLDLDQSAPGSEVVIADGVAAGVPIDTFGTLTTHDDLVRDGVVRYEDPGVIDFAAYNQPYFDIFSGRTVDTQGLGYSSHIGFVPAGSTLVQLPPVAPTPGLVIEADVNGDGVIDTRIADDLQAGSLYLDASGVIQTTTHSDLAHGIDDYVMNFSYRHDVGRFVTLLAVDFDGVGGGNSPIEYQNGVDGVMSTDYGLF